MQIKHIMTTDVITATPDTPITQAANFLYTHGLTGLPVLDKDKKIVGIVTEFDFMGKGSNIHIPSYVEFIQSLTNLKYEKDKHTKEEFKQLASLKVKDIMTTHVFTMREDDEISEFAHVVTEKHINPIPIVNQDNQMVGIVSRSDVVKLFR